MAKMHRFKTNIIEASLGGHNMSNFVPKKPQKIEKDVISIRIDMDLLNKVDDLSGDFGISRNELINQCIIFALDHANRWKD